MVIRIEGCSIGSEYRPHEAEEECAPREGAARGGGARRESPEDSEVSSTRVETGGAHSLDLPARFDRGQVLGSGICLSVCYEWLTSQKNTGSTFPLTGRARFVHAIHRLETGMLKHEKVAAAYNTAIKMRYKVPNSTRIDKALYIPRSELDLCYISIQAGESWHAMAFNLKRLQFMDPNQMNEDMKVVVHTFGTDEALFGFIQEHIHTYYRRWPPISGESGYTWVVPVFSRSETSAVSAPPESTPRALFETKVEKRREDILARWNNAVSTRYFTEDFVKSVHSGLLQYMGSEEGIDKESLQKLLRLNAEQLVELSSSLLYLCRTPFMEELVCEKFASLEGSSRSVTRRDLLRNPRLFRKAIQLAEKVKVEREMAVDEWLLSMKKRLHALEAKWAIEDEKEKSA